MTAGPPLTREAIARALDRLGAPWGRPLVVSEITASTNDDARAAAAAGAPHGAAFVADAQTAGRGRGGHAWHSPPGENLYLSMILRPHVPAAAVAPIALAVGVAMARVVEATVAGRAPATMGETPEPPAQPVWVKWPNDVLVGSPKKKLAGVLVEGQLRGGTVSSLVAGVGVNVLTTSFPPDIAARATSLALLGCERLDRAALAAALLAAIAEAAVRYEETRLASFAADLARMDALRGARVEVGGVRGTAEGIDAEGRLLVRSGSEVTAVVAGEVVLEDASPGRPG